MNIDVSHESPLSLAEPVPAAELETPKKGGFWARGVAYMLDFFVIELIFIFFLMTRAAAMNLASANESGLLGPDPFTIASVGSFIFLWTVLFILYFTFFTYWGGQTPGKMLMSMRVVPRDFGEMSLTRAFIRTLCYFLSSLFLGVGFLIAAVNRDKRALHDLLTGTYVVRV